MDLSRKVKMRREELGWSQGELAKRMGYSSRSSINKIENGRPCSQKIISRLAEALDISIAYLMGWDNNPSESEVPSAISKYNGQFEQLPPMKRYEVIPIACGSPILADVHTDAYIDLPLIKGADMVFRCVGDSMIDAHIYDGDIVFVREQSDVENGEIAAVDIDGEITLKRVYKSENAVQLIPCNAKYPPQVYTPDNCDYFHIVGKAIKFLSEVK